MHILHLNQRNQRHQILFQYLRDKKKKERRGLRKKGGENSPISPPLDPRLLLIDESDCDNIQVTQLGSQQQPMYSGMILPILPKLSINRGKAYFQCTIYTYAFYSFHPCLCLNLYVYRLEEADRADDSFQ